MGLQANPSSKRSIEGLESSTSTTSRSAKQQCTIRVGSEAPDHLTASTESTLSAAWYNSTTTTATTTTTSNYEASNSSAASYVNGAYYAVGDVAVPSEFTPHPPGKNSTPFSRLFFVFVLVSLSFN